MFASIQDPRAASKQAQLHQVSTRGRKTTMAAQLRIYSNNGDDDDGAHALALCLLHDLLGVAAFLASHPLHAAYILFFSRYLLSLVSFFCPLLVSTSLLLVVLVTVAPYVTPEWPGVRFLGSTCGIAVSALCADLRPDGAGASGGVGLVGQLCSFVLGPADVAAVLRVGEIIGEFCDLNGSCFLSEVKNLLLSTEECNKLAVDLQLQCLTGEKVFLDHEDSDEIKDEVEDKIVVCEDLKELKGPDSCLEHCCPSEAFVPEMEEQEDGIKEQRLSLLDMDGVSYGVEEKRLECDPVSMEIKKCEPVKPHSSISGRIRQWEEQMSGNFKQVLDETNDNPVEPSLEKGSLKDMKESLQLETESCTESENLQAQEISSIEESVQQPQEQEFKDFKEWVQPETETPTEKCSEDMQAEESTSIVQPELQLQEQSHKVVQPEPELQGQEFKVVQPEQELQEQDHKDVHPEPEWEYEDVQSEQELQEQDYKDVQTEKELQDPENKNVQPDPEFDELEYNDADEESEVLCNARENSLKSTSIARRVHSRTSSENLVSEGSQRKDKEWKRTLACKLYEERMQLKLCRDRAVVGCSDDMDMLWEAYEAGGGSNVAGDMKRGSNKSKGANRQDEFVMEGEPGEEEEMDDDDDEGSVRQLCCLQALKFSTRKMNFGGGKPSLAKISKVLKRMTALSRVGSRRNLKG